MKLIVAADSDGVVGVHLVGPECSEIIQVSLSDAHLLTFPTAVD